MTNSQKTAKALNSSCTTFVRVAVNIPSDKTFLYAVPAHLEPRIVVGKRVLVPFGKKQVTGFVLEITPVSTVENIREIIDVPDAEPLFDAEDMKFFQWAAAYYIYPLGRALTEILPAGLASGSQRWVCLREHTKQAPEDLPPARQRLLELLRNHPEGLSVERLKKELGRGNIMRIIGILEKQGLITQRERMARAVVSPKTEKIVFLHPEKLPGVRLTERQRRVVEFLEKAGPVSTALVLKTFAAVGYILKSLAKKGILSMLVRESHRRPAAGLPVGMQQPDVILNDDQLLVLQEIRRGMLSGNYTPYLLHGVTGSGKTEIYLRAITETLKAGGGVICLAPEIALTPQLFSRFTQRFPDEEIAMMHSGVSAGARYDQWRRIRAGDIRVVIGARSAVFAPVRNLKLIIVDEEHDSSYKQDDRMRYHARDLAIVKARLNGAVAVLGTATPSLQSYFNSMGKKYRYLHLPQRVEDRPMPAVRIVDMKRHVDEKGNAPVLSPPLVEAIGQTLQARKQSLLFLNRRGFNTFVFCADCGYVFGCLNCSVSMSHHAAAGKLCCHYCNLACDMPQSCIKCRSGRILSYGVGTERLEAEVKKAFPQARTARMDSDTTRTSGAHGRILHSLERGQIDILVGTQMITKGHDFPCVTLVGVVSADTVMNMPDFRAAEKTFQLLAQVAGRSGRGEFPGKVIIQTFNPNHYAVRHAKTHDYEGFYADELPVRQSLSYPPLTRIINLQLSSLNKDRGVQAAGKMAEFAKSRCQDAYAAERIEILGPAEAPIAKIKGRHRLHLLLKGAESKALHSLTRDILNGCRNSGVDIRVDVDPLNFM